MPIFAKNQSKPQQRDALNFSRSHTATSQVKHLIHSSMHLQRMIGHQTVQPLLSGNAEGTKTDSYVNAVPSFAHDFSRIHLHSTRPKAVQTGLTISEPKDKQEQGPEQEAAQAMRLPRAKVSSDGYSPTIQRKCASCEDSREVCSKCAKEEMRVQRRLTTTDMIPVMQHKVGILGEGKEESSQIQKELGKRPEQSIKMHYPQCGTVYGAFASLCYAGTRNWWVKEEVTKEKDTCAPDIPIESTEKPTQSDKIDSPCFTDTITNPNGPPENVAPCKTVTKQIVYLDPAEAEVETYKYKNTQVIEVTLDRGSKGKSGKVITTSAGESKTCDWSVPNED